MRYGLDISAAGPWGDPRTMADMAALGERSGWDGVFLEDYVFFPDGLETYDPWVTLAAIAVATERVTIGTLVTPLPRRRPWKVAAEAMTLDHLSGGRFVLGVGSGDVSADDFLRLREVGDTLSAARALDEGLDVIDRLWSGAEVRHRSTLFDLDGVTMRPRPVQKPRIPIWVGGCLTLSGPRERALRWDGACLYGTPPPEWRDITADEVLRLRETARDRRGDDRFAVAVGGRGRRDDHQEEVRYVTSLAEAGATWWHEYVAPTTPYDEARSLIEGGPIRARSRQEP